MVEKLLLWELAKVVHLDDTLFYRPNAVIMFNKATEILGGIGPGTVILCDFEGIKMCDVSFVDEFIINMQLTVQKMNSVMMILMNCCEDVMTNIEAALTWRNQKSNSRTTLLYFSEGKYLILGKIEKSLNQTFQAIVARPGKVTARDIADMFGLPEINSASNRLKKLYDASLLCRSADESGWQQEYFIPAF